MMGKARTNLARSKYIKVVLVEAAGTAAASRKGALLTMATFKDPVRCFAPIEVIERLLEIRAEADSVPPFISFHPMTWQITSMRSVSTFIRFQTLTLNSVSATIARRSHQAATMCTARPRPTK